MDNSVTLKMDKDESLNKGVYGEEQQRSEGQTMVISNQSLGTMVISD